ncbi:MAG: DUF5317 domain-containing protein [Anaerolineales bacterium]
MALIRGGRFRNLASWAPRWGYLVALALVIQVGVVYLQPESQPLIIALFALSLTLLATFVVANRRLPGMMLLGVGLALNVVAMAANGGFMPVSPGALVHAGLGSLASLPEGSLLEGSKDILIWPEHARLWWLGDVIPLPPPISVVLSIGDLVVGAGGAWYLQVAMVSRERDGSRAHAEVAAP